MARAREPMAIEALRLRIRADVPVRDAVELERLLDDALQAAAARTTKTTARKKAKG